MYNLTRETEWQCTFSERRMYGPVGVSTNIFHTTCMGCTANIAKNFWMRNKSTRFNSINYPGKHNGTVLLTYGTCTEQLEQKQSLDQTTTYSNYPSAPRRFKIYTVIKVFHIELLGKRCHILFWTILILEIWQLFFGSWFQLLLWKLLRGEVTRDL